MAEIQELVDQRVKLINDAREFIATCEKDHDGLTAEESARFDEMHNDADAIKVKIDELHAAEQQVAERLARQEAAEKELSELQNAGDFAKIRGNVGKFSETTEEPINRHNAVNKVLAGWSDKGRAGFAADPELKRQFDASGCSWDNGAGGLYIPLNNQAPTDIRNAQSVGTDTAGGHTTAPGFVSNLEAALLQFGGVRQVANVIRTATGSALDWPTVNDTSNSGALLAENTQDSEQDVTFGNLTLNAYKYTSKIVRVSAELMQDSIFDMGSTIGALVGERLGRIQNTHATTGTGSSQPNGIVTAATLGKTTAGATAITMDELLDLQASVDPAYRVNGTWMMNDATRNYVRKLKSSDSNYHWQPSAIAGDPDRLFNNPVVINQDMASIATSAKTVLFGDVSKYLIREVLGVTLIRMDERYADYGQVAFVAITRFDSDLLDAGTNPVKYLAQA